MTCSTFDQYKQTTSVLATYCGHSLIYKLLLFMYKWNKASQGLLLEDTSLAENENSEKVFMS